MTAKVEVVCPEGNELGSSSAIKRWTLLNETNGLGSRTAFFNKTAIPPAIKRDNAHNKTILLTLSFLYMMDKTNTKTQATINILNPPKWVIIGIMKSKNGFCRLWFI